MMCCEVLRSEAMLCDPSGVKVLVDALRLCFMM